MWEKLTSILLFSVLILSCSDHPSENSLLLEKEEGLINFSIDIPKSSIYTKVKNDTDSGEKKEQRVNSMRLIFYSENTAQYVFDLDIKTNNTGSGFEGNDVVEPNTNTPSNDNIIRFITKPLLLKKKEYQVVALINPNEKVKTITEVGKPLSALNAPVDISSIDEIISRIDDGGNKSYDNFYMSNTSGPIIIQDIAGPGGFHKNYNDALNDGKRPTLSVERAVSKVSFVVNMENSTPSIGGYALNISGLQWTVDVLNKKLYWLRRMTYKKGGINSSPKPGEDNNMEKPSDYKEYDSGLSRRLYLYAEDPNFTGIFNLSETDLLKQFAYYNPNLSTEWIWKSANETFYLPENTMDFNDDFKMNVSTQVILRIPCTPDFNGSKFMYYRIPIRHFVDNALQDIGGNSDNNEDGPGGDEEVSGGGGFVGSAARFWGGYGVVRNNYYKLSLNSIDSIGYSQLSYPPKDIQNIY